MNYFNEVLGILLAAKPLGYERLSDGTQVIGHVPHVAPKAFLHELYPPLSAEEMEEVEKLLGKSLPLDFGKFLAMANGCFLFSGSLSIYGRRTSYARTEI